MEHPQWYENKKAREKIRYATKRQQILAQVAAYRIRMTEELLTHYGPTCVLCGEPDARVLTLDHINNDGAQDRKRNRLRGLVEMSVYLRNKQWPAEYRILCYNCNYLQYTQYRKTKLIDNTRNRIEIRGSRRAKRDVVTNYGRYCAICHESNIDILEIDHINNDGAEARRESNISSGAQLYRFLRRSGYPPGFQVLCRNHNILKYRVEILKQQPFSSKLLEVETNALPYDRIDNTAVLWWR